jgi:hypothetical protein
MSKSRYGALWALIVLCLATWLFARDFGPEWKRDGDVYRREVTVPVSHSVGGNVSGYQLKLENDMLHVSDLDNDVGITIERRPHEELQIRKNEDGSVASYRVVLNKVRYHDFNGDGFIDSMQDSRPLTRKTWILFEGRFIEVSAGKSGASAEIVSSMDRGTTYVFDTNRWVVQQPARRRN